MNTILLRCPHCNAPTRLPSGLCAFHEQASEARERDRLRATERLEAAAEMLAEEWGHGE